MRLMTRVAAAVAAVALPALLAAAPAQAVAPKGEGIEPTHAACGTNAPNLDRRGPFTGATAGARIRTGSSTTCTARGSIQPTHRLDYYCWTWGNDGLTWTFLKNLSTTTPAGWVRDDLLPVRDNVRGSNVYCGF